MGAQQKPRGQRLLERVREERTRHRRRGRAYRVAVGVAGATLILAGLLLSAPGVPGPGLVLLGLGLALLALEFERAERLLERLAGPLDRLSEQAERAKPWQKALGAFVVALGVGAAIGAVLLWDVPFFPG